MKLFSRDIWLKTQPQDKWAHECVFCNHNKLDNSQYIIWKGEHWLIIHNKYPILWSDKHIMLIPIKHHTFPHECSSTEMSEFPVAQKFIHDFFGDVRYFSFMRESLANRSLEHFHYHYLPWKMWYTDIEYFLKQQGF